MGIEPQNVQRAQGAAPSTESQRSDARASKVDGAAFRAILERMEESARAIARTSEDVEDPRDLGAAVGRAREALDEALSLGGDLLEAYRAAQARTGNAQNTEPQSGSGGSR
ncbi:MAG: hypothetical protein AAFZ87_20995 [Planctomycetota bacterium]